MWWKSWIFSMHYSSLKLNFVLLSMLKTVVLLDIFVETALHYTSLYSHFWSIKLLILNYKLKW